MAWITDSLRGAINAIGHRLGFQTGTALPNIFTHQLAIAAYMSSGMLRKVIQVPAADRVQKWRDWQAPKETIALIEAEEKRLGLRSKAKAAEVLRGLGGGALILITAGDHSQPLRPDAIAKGGLVAVNLVSRWQIDGDTWDEDLASPSYGTPRMFKISGGRGGQQRIHPSRVVCFRGDPIPAGAGIPVQEAFWGDCRLLRVYTEVTRSDETQAWFSALVRKAKLLRVGIPNLTDFTSTESGQAKLNSRIALIAEGENTLNAVVYDAGNGKDSDSGGEKIDDYQITWAGIPAVMDAFDQRVAAVADIPFTRLMGRSPAGMNSTGQHDMDNWHDAVSDGQENELRPCLEQIDPVLLRSAGVADPAKVWWKFAPLDTPTEKEQAETLKLLLEAVDKLELSGLVPHEALARAVQNLLEERGDLPGLAEALAAMSEDERFGLSRGDGDEGDDTDPSQIQAQQPKGGDPGLAGRGGARDNPARRAANDALMVEDATPRTLYVQRKLLNAAEFIAWAKGQGFDTVTAADDLHVTVAYSKTPLDWMKIEGEDWNQEKDGSIEIAPGGVRIVEVLGDKGAVVLLFTSSRLSWRHEQIMRAGASHDFPEYQPHVTITYAKPEGLDLSKVEPFRGTLRFGPEIFETQTDGWRPSEV